MKPMIFTAFLVALAAACGDDGAVRPTHDASPVVDAAVADAPPPPCFSGTPTTHLQIINACTSAQQIYKDSHPPLVGANGSLPQLPP